jgi:hypothetical protein
MPLEVSSSTRAWLARSASRRELIRFLATGLRPNDTARFSSTSICAGWPLCLSGSVRMVVCAPTPVGSWEQAFAISGSGTPASTPPCARLGRIWISSAKSFLSISGRARPPRGGSPPSGRE